MRKRYRRPKPRKGELLASFGKVPGEPPDVCYSWGEGVEESDKWLLFRAFGMKRPDYFTQPLFSKMKPSLIQELETRGYDITTLRFSIRKKNVVEACEFTRGRNADGEQDACSSLQVSRTSRSGEVL